LTRSGHLQESFGISLGLVARLWRNEVDRRLAALGLTESRWLALLYLSRMPHPVTQRELADAMGVQGPTLVHILDWLESEALVERRTASGDRRSKAVHLASKAAPVLKRIEHTTAAVRSEILSGISEPDMRICLHVFEQLAGKLGGPPRLVRRADSASASV
jgi:MarR family transcriptional regulator for hemolysin